MSETADLAAAPASAPAGEPQGTSSGTGGIIVHHLNNSRSQRVLWLLVRYSFCPIRCRFEPVLGFAGGARDSLFNQGGFDATRETIKYLHFSQKYERLPSRLAPPELKEVFPLGKSPILQDGDLTLAESGAIVGETYHMLFVTREHLFLRVSLSQST